MADQPSILFVDDEDSIRLTLPPLLQDRAEQSLQTAKKELEGAGAEWGGHRVQAIKHIDAALHELELGEQWARQHHDIK